MTRKSIDEHLWSSKWYPWLWDHTYGPFFHRYREWKFRRDLAAQFGGKIPEVGDIVCTCNYTHGTIVEKHDADSVIIQDENGNHMGCSLYHCCSPVNHEWQHPLHEELEAWRKETQREIDEHERTRE